MKILIWFLDNFLAIILIKSNKSICNRIVNIPERFEQKFCEVSSKLINFRTSALFGTKATLQLKEDELNLISLKSYIDSREEDIKDYVFSKFLCYSIIDENQLILRECYPFFFFKFIFLSSDFFINFKLNNGKIIQQRKNKSFFGKKNNSLEYYDFDGFSDSDLLINILGSIDSSDYRSESTSRRRLLEKTAEPIIKKITSVTVSNNFLILCC